jgi:hypothetical protein
MRRGGLAAAAATASAALLAAALAGCPGAQQCATSADCSAGQVCAQGRCQADGEQDAGVCREVGGTAGNLLDNPHFECGQPPLGWSAQFGTVAAITQDPHGGAQAARLTAPNAAAVVSLWHDADAVAATNGGTYCARAWLRGSGVNGRLDVRRVLADGSGGDNISFSIPLERSWSVVPPSQPLKIESAGFGRLLVRVVIPSARAGDTLDVDDVALWASADGSCSER